MLNSSPLAAGDEVIKLDRPRLDMANNLITDFKVEDLNIELLLLTFGEQMFLNLLKKKESLWSTDILTEITFL